MPDPRAIPTTVAPSSAIWKRGSHDGIRYWLAGRTRGAEIGKVLESARLAAGSGRPEAFARTLSELNGHFALLAEGEGWSLALVDRVRSIPLFWARGAGAPRVGANPVAVAEAAGIDRAGFDGDALLSLAMAGYTTGSATILSGLHALRAGEYLLAGTAGADAAVSYHVFRPWACDRAGRSDDDFRRELRDRTLAILSRLASDAGGREIVVPLSGGNDSRLIVSGLRHLGVRNIRCFSYGHPGNFEAEIARKICESLGVEWRMVATRHADRAAYFRSDLRAGYLRFADSFVSTPFEQDLAPVAFLKREGWIPGDAIVVNGNSGDYISGAHVPLELARWVGAPEDLTAATLDLLVRKHYSLWRGLMTPAATKRIKDLLRREIAAAVPEGLDGQAAHAAYEYSELMNRQSKYVITGQRVYEYLGLEWALPLWDDDYLAFWEKVPIRLKESQTLYAAMLIAENWCGVWRDIPVNRKWVTPRWAAAARSVVKLLASPLALVDGGREIWHSLDKRLFAYWIDPLGNYAVTGYARVVADRIGFRNSISWLTEAYLRSKGFDVSGRPGRMP